MRNERQHPRARTPDSWVKIQRRGSLEGHQIVRLSNVSEGGLAFETLTKTPYQIGEKILIIETPALEFQNRWSAVVHISQRKNEEDFEIYVVGVKFES